MKMETLRLQRVITNKLLMTMVVPEWQGEERDFAAVIPDNLR